MQTRIPNWLVLVALVPLISACADGLRYPAIPSSSLTPDQKRTIDSLTEVNDHPTFSMHYYGSYDWILSLKREYYRLLGLPAPKCTTFAALGAPNSRILGHNSDGSREPILLLYTSPPGAFRAVSVVLMGGFGFSERARTANERIVNNLLYSPYFQLDSGMNEMGLAYAVMADPGSYSTIDPAMDTLLPGEAMRLCLDHARSVDEALALLSSHNIKSDGIGSHYLFADQSGDAAVVEWVDGRMETTRANEQWQVAANHSIYRSAGKAVERLSEYRTTGTVSNDVNGNSYLRYSRAADLLEKVGGSLTMGSGMELLESVSLTEAPDIRFPTQFSILYNLSDRSVWMCTDRHYGQVIRIDVPFKE